MPDKEKKLKQLKRLANATDPGGVFDELEALEATDEVLAQNLAQQGQLIEGLTARDMELANFISAETLNLHNLITEQKDELSQEIKEIQLTPGPKGDNYILTPADKLEIASRVTVPVVEKVIERTEVVKEQPIVTHETVEVAVGDLPEELVGKLNSLSQVLEPEVVIGLPELSERVRRLGQVSSLPVTTSFFNGLRAKNMTVVGATARQEGDTVFITPLATGGGVSSLNGLTGDVTLSAGSNITLTPVGNDIEISATGGGTPGGSDTQVQFNDGGAFGGDAGFVYDKTTDTATLGTALIVPKVQHVSGGIITLSNNDTTGHHLFTSGQTLNSASGTDLFFRIAPVINGSGTQGYNALEIDVTETAVGSGVKNLLALQVANADKFTVSNAGLISGASLNLSGLTASELVATDASKNLQSLAVATYPSLTELTYVKGVTSAIQTQLNGKAPSLGADDNYVTDAQLTLIAALDADLATFALPASTTISAFGATLIDDAAASNARTTLGLGTIATEAETAYVLLAGRATPQQINFGTASGAATGYLSSTAHATKGKYFLNAAGTIAVDELNTRLGIGVASPTEILDIVTAASDWGILTASKESGGAIVIQSGIYNGTAGGQVGAWMGVVTNHPWFVFTNNGSPQATFGTNGFFAVGPSITTPLAMLDVRGNVRYGAGAAGVDYTRVIDGETNDFLETWMEDEDYLAFNDDLFMNSTEAIYFAATGNRIYQRAANVLTVEGNVTTEVGKDGDIPLCSTNDRNMYPATTGKVSLGKTGTNGFAYASLVQRAGLTGDGDIWYDSTQKALQAYMGTTATPVEQTLATTLYAQTADKTVANTTTETTIFGTGVGTQSIPANYLVAGRTFRITLSGVYSTVAVTGDTVTVRVKYGSTTLALKATSALVIGATNLHWWGEVLVTCRTTGATGTVQVGGGIRYQIAGSAIVEDELNHPSGTAGGGTATVDTTAGGTLDVTVTHSAANASNSIKSLVSAIQILQ